MSQKALFWSEDLGHAESCRRNSSTIGLVLGAVAPAEAATVEREATYERASSLEWHWYLPTQGRVWFTRAETEAMWRKQIVGAAGMSIVSLGCDFIKQTPIKVACKAFGALTIANFLYQVRDAHKHRSCLTFSVRFVGLPPTQQLQVRGTGFQDYSGKRCK